MKRAVHFGAGNIGRGFVALMLHRAGYHVTFVDVQPDVINALNAAQSYTVTEVGGAGTVHTVTDFDAIDSREHPVAAVEAVAGADVVTCAVGPGVLRFIAPVIRDGLRARAGAAPLTVMACENAIGATDTLAGFVLEGAGELASAAVFANTAVDRIIPAQEPGGVDVVVEDFFEWAIDRTPFAGREPSIPDAHFVDDLAPYIERKLFTVNTGHATTAYHGYLAGAVTIADALELAEVRAEVEAALAETSALLIDKYGFDRATHEAYVRRTLGRFANRALPDTCERIGRAPLRKISRHERFIGPASALAERGLAATALVRAYGAALRFDVPSDAEAVELGELLLALEPAAFVTRATGLGSDDALFAEVVEATLAARAARVSGSSAT